MKPGLFILSGLLLIFSANAQVAPNLLDENGLKQGHWQVFDNNGALVYDGHFTGGKPVGLMKRYYPNGNVKAEMFYIAGSDSVYAGFFGEDGTLIAKGKYFRQKKEGEWNFFYKGNLLAKEEFSNGIRNGISEIYFTSGSVSEQTVWKNGKREGSYVQYYLSGKPMMACNYAGDKRNGFCVFYFENGLMEIDAAYLDDKRHGNWTYFDPSGEIIYVLEYKNGILLNPEVPDSIENRKFDEFNRNRDRLFDPEQYMDDPEQYMRKSGIIR